MKTQERLTSQKKIIMDYLMSVKTHPTAEEVCREVKKKLPRISQGTVYRILNNFKKKGGIQEIPTRISRYDGDASLHAHFICENCGRVVDVADPFIVNIRKDCPILKRKKVKAGKINKHQVYFYGICNKCQK